jgi:hypothetical protein
MCKQFLISVTVGILALGVAQTFAETSATAVMRNGDRVRVDIVDMGAAFTFRINGQEQSVPISDVVLIDFASNGRHLPADEVARANDASGNGFVVMRNGDHFTSRLVDVTSSGNLGIFSGDRRIEFSQVARVYLGSVGHIPEIATPAPNVGEAGLTQNTRTSSVAPRRARTIVVPANVEWTNTGMRVSRGQTLRFEPSGEIRLSFNAEDVATAAGGKNQRFVEKSQLPTIPVGALIGRVGSGQPFSIGDTTQAFRMPANGRLFLGVNDDHVPDNSGNLVVKVWEP